MIRYNISKPTGPQAPFVKAAPGHTPRPVTVLSMRHGGRLRFGLVSVLLHGAAFAALMGLAMHVPEPVPPEEVPVEMVFQQPAEEVTAPPEPVVETQLTPEPSPPEPAPSELAPQETPPPELPAPASPEPTAPPEPPSPPEPESRPQPIPPPPELPLPPEPVPPPEAPRAPPPPKPRPPARPVVKPVAVKPPEPMREVVPRAARSAPAIVPSLPARTTPAAPPPVAAPPAPAGVPVVDPSWQRAVAGLLASGRNYPEEARRRGEEGRVIVRFTVDRSGRVVEASVVGPSGATLLDAAALSLLRQASLPAFPPSMTQARISITTSVRYTLR